MTTVADDSAKGFWCDSTTEHSGLAAMRRENENKFLLSTIFTFHLTCEFLVTYRIGYIRLDSLTGFAAPH